MRVPIRGIRVNLEIYGVGPPLLLLHGFLGNAGTWSAVIDDLSRTHRCMAVDLLGHGGSDAPRDWKRYTIQESASDVLALLDSLAIKQTAVLGYSMGGRVGLSVAVKHPVRVTSLICESASPGLEVAAERRNRLQDDERLAGMIETEGLESFVDYWQELPLFASQQSLSPATGEQIRATRLATEPVGAANSLRGLSQGRYPSIWEQLAVLRIPMLIVAGNDDAKYRDIAIRMQGMIRNAELAIIPKSGHTVHIEQPAAFAAAVLDFLRRHPQRT